MPKTKLPNYIVCMINWDHCHYLLMKYFHYHYNNFQLFHPLPQHQKPHLKALVPHYVLHYCQLLQDSYHADGIVYHPNLLLQQPIEYQMIHSLSKQHLHLHSFLLSHLFLRHPTHVGVGFCLPLSNLIIIYSH